MIRSDHLLEVRNLEVVFPTREGTVQAVRGVSFTVDAGESLGVVGESGSGKSTLARAALGMIELPGRIAGGEILWRGRSLLDKRVARRIRGREISMVSQDPMASMSPILTIGTQMTEVMTRHLDIGRREAFTRAGDLLEKVGIPDPGRRLGQYPFEFSGGMQQRVVIATALSCDPMMLIADEPTTALDVTTQAQILELISSLQKDLGLALVLITHDLGVVAGACDLLKVLYAGEIVESGTADQLFHRPRHPYTAALLGSTPRLDVKADRLMAIEGHPPDLRHVGGRCSFTPRCPHATTRCTTESPVLQPSEAGRAYACWNPLGGREAPELPTARAGHG
ncbi:MAG: ABC transporter ATP-binding protein [bacterium]|nr:ABC transporter ATP-binding protein [bacterium]